MSVRNLILTGFIFLFVAAGCGSDSSDPGLEFVALTEDGSTLVLDEGGSVDVGAEDTNGADPGTSPDIPSDTVSPPEDTKPKTECELAGIPDTGACDGDNLIGCVNDEVFTVDCAQLGLFCGPDSTGALSCVPDECTPACEGKSCGSDGCGGTCGSCEPGASCDDEGQCVSECEAQCDGKSCGPDGCGGSCGACELGFLCNDSGQCEKDCKPQCEGKDCGPDGCGGFCGLCSEGDFCTDQGFCKPECSPSCDGKSCGPDGCGGICGECEDGDTCNDGGQCVSQCVPECTDKQCGPDGCGGSCGTCDTGFLCGDNGKCKEIPDPCDDCAPDEICQDDVCVKDPACGPYTWVGCCKGGSTIYCQNGDVITQNCNQACGWVDNKQWYYCGGDGSDPTGEFPIECPCVPNCDGKQCGGDGCGGTCGECGPNQACESNQCVTVQPVDPCEGIPSIGQCDGDLKITCDDGELQEEDCSEQNKVCWVDIIPTLKVECKWPWLANCPDFLLVGYCSGNLLVQCQGDDISIVDCEQEGKVCGYTGIQEGWNCIESD